MPVRLPQGLVADPREAAHSTLEHELLAETAAALGRVGRKVAASLAALEQADPDKREALTDAAADAVYALMVQRELCGMRYAGATLTDYAVPSEVIARIGVRRPER